MPKVTFSDLSIWLKIAIIAAWLSAITYLYYFGLGFLEGLSGAV